MFAYILLVRTFTEYISLIIYFLFCFCIIVDFDKLICLVDIADSLYIFSSFIYYYNYFVLFTQENCVEQNLIGSPVALSSVSNSFDSSSKNTSLSNKDKQIKIAVKDEIIVASSKMVIISYLE